MAFHILHKLSSSIGFTRHVSMQSCLITVCFNPSSFNLHFTELRAANNCLGPPFRIFPQYLKTAEKGCFTLKRPYLITVNLKIRLIYILVLATFGFSGRLEPNGQGCWIMRVSLRGCWLHVGMTFVSHGNSTYP